MKTPKFRLFAPTFAAIPVAMVTSMLLSSPSAMAVNYMWNNTGTTWNGTSSWVGGVAPISNSASTTDTVEFGNATANFNTVYLASNRTVLGATFDAGANAYTFTTDAVTPLRLAISTTGIANNSTATQTFNLSVDLTSGNSTWQSVLGGSLIFNNGINLSTSAASRTLTVAGAGNFTVNQAIANGGTATAGVITITGTGITTFSGNNTYDGLTTMNATGGTLTLSGNNSGAAGGVTLTAGSLNINNNNALGSGALTLGGTGATINNTSGSAVVNAGNQAWALVDGLAFGTSTNTAANNLNLGSGVVTASGGRSITLAGTGTTLTIGAVNITSTSSGRTLIANGVGNTLNIGGLTLSGNTTSAVTVSLDGTANIGVTGAIVNGQSFANGVQIKGIGTKTFSGVNTYTGSTAIDAGVLSIGTISNGGVAGGLGMSTNAAANLLFTGSSTLQYTGSSASTDRNFTISSGKTATFDVTSATTALTISGASTGATGAITKIGAGTLIFTGANTHTGGTTIQDGTLNITTGNSAVGLFTLASASASAPILKLSNVNALATTATLLGASGAANAGTLDMAVAGAYSLAAYTGQNMKFTASSGSATTLTFTGNSAVSTGTNGSKTITNTDSNLTIAFAGNLDISSSTAGTLTVTGAGNTSVAGALTNTGSATRGLEKSGAGTLTLSGANSYNGATNVNAGKLVINGNSSTSTGNVSVATGATLGGSGLLGGATSVTGTLAPGNSIESLGLGALSFVTGSTYAYELNSSSFAGDLTYSSGSLNIAAGSILTLTELFSGTLATNSKLTLISSVGAWNGGLFTYNSSTLADDSEIVLGSNTWKFNYNDTLGGSNYTSDQAGAANFVTLTVIPEPNVAMVVGGLGVLALLRRRNR